MNVRPRALLALVALLVPAPGAWSAPREPAVMGLTCGLAAQGSPDRGLRSGVISAGPWVTTSSGAIVVSVTCSIQIGSDDPAADDAVRVVGPGGFLPPTPVSYDAFAGANTFVCTEVTVHWPPDPPTVEMYDADPQRPGAQCQKAHHSQTSLIVFDFQPSNPAGWWCARVDHGLPPYGYQEVCNPFA